MTAKLGIEDRAEMEKEATIEDKIRIRKKEKAKKKAEASRRMEQYQPKRKKIRLAEKEGDNIEEDKRQSKEERRKTTPKKRKVIREEGQQKRARPNSKIRKYITCKRWKEMEGQQETGQETPITPELGPANGEKTGNYIDREGHGEEPTPGKKE